MSSHRMYRFCVFYKNILPEMLYQIILYTNCESISRVSWERQDHGCWHASPDGAKSALGSGVFFGRNHKLSASGDYRRRGGGGSVGGEKACFSARETPDGPEASWLSGEKRRGLPGIR